MEYAELVTVDDEEAVRGGGRPHHRLGAAQLRLVHVDVAHLGERGPVARLLHLGQLLAEQFEIPVESYKLSSQT